MRGLLCLLCVLPAVWAFDCVGTPNGVYEGACKFFIKCVNGVAHPTECSAGTVSSGGTWQNISCADESTVGPPCGSKRDCSGLADGRYADVWNNCTSYFTCHGHTYFGHNYCAGGLVFNEVLGSCDWPNPGKPCHTTAPVVG